jgi:hypothetical protein
MFMELWDNSVDLRRVFDQSDIKVGNALFFSKKNVVDKTLVQSLFKQVSLRSFSRLCYLHFFPFFI